MFTRQRPIRFSAVRFAIIAVIGIPFFTLAVAGTSAAHLSFIDSLKGFFGINQPAERAASGDDLEKSFASTTLVISQAYGGGGGSTGTYLHDYVELKNISSSPQSLNGLSLYYGSAAGQFASTATNAFALPDTTLNPGQYYLVQLGAAGTAGAPLPVTPDATTTNLSMSATNGKVALVTAALPINTCGATATPCALPNAAIIDLVAWGTANNAEGGAATNAGASLTSVQGNVRKNNGCQDTDNNNNDFDIITAPVPRNTATAPASCGGATPTASPSPTSTTPPISATPTNTATATATITATATASPSPAQGGTLVLSQVDGGGGGSTGTYLNDYVEIKNISSSPRSLNGLSLYYGSALGNFASTATNAFALPDVSLNPGQYYLVQLGNAGTVGAPLPVTPDATTTNLNMSGTNGKVALVTAGLAINTCGATATPCDATQLSFIVDWVAYGAAGNGTAGNGEGGTSVNNGAALTPTQGGVRKQNGCQDTNNNNNDFDVVTDPVPRNSSTAAAPCVVGTPTNTATASPSPTNTFTPTNTATATATITATATASPSPAQPGQLVLSQVDGGGGGSTGTYLFDYVEIKNISSSARSLAGLWLYYGSATGNFATTASNAFELPNVSLNPGQYYLVQLGTAGTIGAQFPVTPDVTTANLNMSGTNGKVALVTSSLAQNACGSAATPCDATQLSLIVDWVAYGAAGNGTAGNGEGGTSVNNGVAMVATQGGVRKSGGCQDTNNNNNDFDVVTDPVPRNSSSAAAPCAGGPSPTLTSTSTSTATATATNTPTGAPTSTPSCSGNTPLSADQEVPPNSSLGTGLGAVSLNADQNLITVNLSFSGLTSNATAAHIHGPAAIGVNAPVLFGLAGVPGAMSGSIPQQTFAVTPTQVAQLRAGLLYFNVHTGNFPGGEIRGQILLRCSAVRADFDGDGKSDVSVFRPAEGNWFLNRTNAGLLGVTFGLNGDLPIPGDYDGDGKTDIAVFRGDPTGQNPNHYILNSSDNTVTYAYWGLNTDTPLSGDYDGDGKTDITVYRASNNTWYIMRSSGGSDALNFGAAGDLPLFMDYDGDGRSDIAVFRPSNGTWYIARRTGIPAQNFDAIPFGTNGDMPVPADFDGDRKDDVAVFRPSTGTWYGLLSLEGFAAVNFGLNGDIPVPADYDGDSQADVAVYRNGIWYFDLSGSGFTAVNYGISTDIPLPKRYIP